MTAVEFKEKLNEVFQNHLLMKGRNHHTVNELLYVLRYSGTFDDLNNVNISVARMNDSWLCIPCLDAFVDVKTLGIWFDDDVMEFDIEKFETDGMLTECTNITVYERGEE
jgi:hypothetical protein